MAMLNNQMVRVSSGLKDGGSGVESVKGFKQLIGGLEHDFYFCIYWECPN